MDSLATIEKEIERETRRGRERERKRSYGKPGISLNRKSSYALSFTR